MSFHKSFSSGTDTSDATAKQWDIKNGLTAYIASGKVTGSGYFPARMEFDGSTGYYSKSAVSQTGNKVTFFRRFHPNAFTGDVVRYVCRADGDSNLIRGALFVTSSDHSTLTNRRSKLTFLVKNDANADICLLVSDVSVLGSDITVFASFDGDAGAATFYINGADADDTGNADRVAPTTGTLDAGNGIVSVNATTSGTLFLGGYGGAFGYDDSYLTNWSDFMQTDGTPKQISEASASPQWAEWGGQPLFWHESGLMTENKGSVGAMTKNGTIILAPASSWS